MEVEQETILERVRLHWGIFVPVGLVGVAGTTLVISFLFLTQRLMTMFAKLLAPLGHTGNPPSMALIGLLPLLPLAAAIIGLLLVTWAAYVKSEITLTNRRLMFRTGFLAKHSGEWPLENVDSILISEPLIGRVFGYGTVTVTTLGGSRVPLSYVRSPQRFHAALQAAVLLVKNPVGAPGKPSMAGPGARNDDRKYMPKD